MGKSLSTLLQITLQSCTVSNVQATLVVSTTGFSIASSLERTLAGREHTPAGKEPPTPRTKSELSPQTGLKRKTETDAFYF